MPTKLIASSLALIAFALAIALGAIAGNSASTAIWRALLAMMVCYVVGLIIGYVARCAMQEHVEHYKVAHPLPDMDSGLEHGEPVEDSAGQKTQDAATGSGRVSAGQAA